LAREEKSGAEEMRTESLCGEVWAGNGLKSGGLRKGRREWKMESERKGEWRPEKKKPSRGRK
jgi:hypothetical protein